MRATLSITISAVIIWAYLVGCNAFTAREPEPPDGSGQLFIPPTTPQTVIDNFLRSIRQKSPDNYTSCFAVNGLQTDRTFNFEPSADALGRYGAFFSGWTVQRERQSFIALLARIPADKSPQIEFSEATYELLQPDSAVFVARYIVIPEHTDSNVPQFFSGRVRFTLQNTSSGLWEISRWSDIAETSAEPVESWSILKAVFSN